MLAALGLLLAEGSVPTWTAVLIAIAGSALGGVAGSIWTTWRQLRHQEEEQMRTLMLAAADDFATGILQAQLALQEVVNPGEMAMALVLFKKKAEIKQRVDESFARLARVMLLFGDNTPAGKAARRAAESQGAVLANLEEGEEADELQASIDFRNGAGYLAIFVAEARKAARKPLDDLTEAPEDSGKGPADSGDDN
jgi:hypothetical protein